MATIKNYNLYFQMEGEKPDDPGPEYEVMYDGAVYDTNYLRTMIQKIIYLQELGLTPIVSVFINKDSYVNKKHTTDDEAYDRASQKVDRMFSQS